jgi:hypothetical protein
LYKENVQGKQEAGHTSGIAINPLKPELNPSAKRCLTRFFTGDFAS